MVAITNFFLYATVATAASIYVRDAAQILADLKDINLHTNNLTNWVNAYNGGGGDPAVAVAQASDILTNSIKSATTNAQKSAVVSSANAQSIIDYINNTLEPSLLKDINAIINKKAVFVKDGLKDYVLNDLKGSKNNTEIYANALLTKTPSDKKTAATNAKTKVLADVQKGIDSYSS